MQGHGRTADINRDFSYASLADDIAAMLDYLKIEQADLLGYSMGGGVAMQVARAPFLFIHGDADGVRLDHIAEMFRLKGDEIMGDMRPRSESRLAVLPNTTHVTLMDKASAIILMVNDFLDAKPQKR